jgi:hypothetical protein
VLLHLLQGALILRLLKLENIKMIKITLNRRSFYDKMYEKNFAKAISNHPEDGAETPKHVGAFVI